MQLLLFDDLPHEHVEEEDGKVCSMCGVRKRWEFFAYKGQVPLWLRAGMLYLTDEVLEDKTHYRKTCRKCEAKKRKLTRCLRESAPPIPDCCDCCGVYFKSLESNVKRNKSIPPTYLDHCHDTDVFRGWLCHKCNVGIGLLGDTLEGLNKAIAYLEKFERNKDV